MSGRLPAFRMQPFTMRRPALCMLPSASRESCRSIDPRTGASTQITTAAGAHTTAFVAPDRLYVFSPAHRGLPLFLRILEEDRHEMDHP